MKLILFKTKTYKIMANENKDTNPKIDIEYCRVCDYGGHCLELAKKIKESSPDVTVACKQGRQGSFEVVVNEKLIYSKLKTMALPDYEEIVDVISDVSKGGEPREIKGQQPIDCVIT